MNPIPDIYKKSSYEFPLPEELIAQYPCEPRDAARLLIINRCDGTLEEGIFSDIKLQLNPGDTLVVNETRVIPARLYGIKESGGRVEILLLKQVGERVWEVLVKPARRVKTGTWVGFLNSSVKARVDAELMINGGRRMVFYGCDDMNSFLETFGHMPLPPYINRTDEKSDQSSYQTVYAQTNGSVAAPTAGLHFTEQLLQDLQERGINIARLLLHVGLGTFRPVSCEDIRRHQMHREYYDMNQTTADLLNDTRSRGNKVIGVGTTVVRTLETVYDKKKGYEAGTGETEKYIYPGYTFQAVDQIITNFHLPGSSLLMLVSAFGGFPLIREAYAYAVAHKYRFYSFGDAMLIR